MPNLVTGKRTRIRRSVPPAARTHLVVLGGFTSSTEYGRTTTLGRGGSDLTASIVGAAINADEIQVWKDVDSILTCDPRVLDGGLQVKRLSYREATELAQADATILHPSTGSSQNGTGHRHARGPNAKTGASCKMYLLRPAGNPIRHHSCDDLSFSFNLAVPGQNLLRCVDLLHRLLFSHPNPNLFSSAANPKPQSTVAPLAPSRQRAKYRRFAASTALVQTNA